MFAPEFVLYAAYLQWKNARELCKMLKTLGGKPGLRRTLRQEIASIFTAAKGWIVKTLRRVPTTPLGTLKQPKIGHPESKHSELVQQQFVGLNLDNSGSEQRDPVQRANKPESVSSGFKQQDPKQPTIQRQDLAQPDLTLPETTPRNSAPPKLTKPESIVPAWAPLDTTPQDTTQPCTTQQGSTSPHLTQSDWIPPKNTPPLGPTPHGVQPDERWCQISMVAAFYIVMGGFAYDISDLSNHHEYIALTPKGFMEFAKAGHITPDILNDKGIADRSKADPLGKLLVSIQALWMVVNCIARKASGLPTTLIELNVIVHVVVAVVVYTLWWHKPLAVANPSLLHRQRVSSMGQLSDSNGDAPNVPEIELLAFLLRVNLFPSGKLRRQELDQGLVIEPYPADRTHKEFNVNFQPYMPDPQRFEIQGEPRVSRKTCANVIGDLNIKSPGIIILPGQQLALKAHRYVFRNPEEALWMAYFISSDELHWLDIECAYRRRYETGDISPLDSAMAESPRNLTTFDPPNYLVQGSVYTGDINIASRKFNIMENAALFFMIGLLSCFYAGAHASAWSSHFPSYIERWIWRGACICIAAGVPFARALWVFPSVIGDCLVLQRQGRVVKLLKYLLAPIIFLLFGLSIISYIVARLFIPLEAFISIRSLPIGAFENVEWVEYWPHVCVHDLNFPWLVASSFSGGDVMALVGVVCTC